MVTNELHLPASFPSDFAVGGSQRDGCEHFYSQALPSNLTSEQAGDLLDYRDLAFGIVDRVAPRIYGEDRRMAAEAVAIFVSRDRGAAKEVVSLMRRRFEKGADPDGLKRAVSRLECFDDLEGICLTAIGR